MLAFGASLWRINGRGLVFSIAGLGATGAIGAFCAAGVSGFFGVGFVMGFIAGFGVANGFVGFTVTVFATGCLAGAMMSPLIDVRRGAGLTCGVIFAEVGRGEVAPFRGAKSIMVPRETGRWTGVVFFTTFD